MGCADALNYAIKRMLAFASILIPEDAARRRVQCAPYQDCSAPQCGQVTLVETGAENTQPQVHV